MGEKVLVIGASGHAKVIIEILEENGYEVAGLIDDFSVHQLWNYSVVGTTADLKQLRERELATAAFVAIGDNAVRKRCIELATRTGFKLVNAISRFSIISRYAQLGTGVAVLVEPL